MQGEVVEWGGVGWRVEGGDNDINSMGDMQKLLAFTAFLLILRG